MDDNQSGYHDILSACPNEFSLLKLVLLYQDGLNYVSARYMYSDCIWYKLDVLSFLLRWLFPSLKLYFQLIDCNTVAVKVNNLPSCSRMIPGELLIY